MIVLKAEGFDLGTANGSRCYLCGAGDQRNGLREPVLNTGAVIDFEGKLEICLACGKEIGGLVGMIPSEAYRLLGAEYDELMTDLKEMQRKLQDKEDAIKLLSAELVGASHKGVYGTNTLPVKKKPGPKPQKVAKPIQEGL